MLSGKRIILGVTGGIAAYKAVQLLRDFQKAGAEVRVIMTPDATRFVGSDTFAALSRNDVPIHIFPENHSGSSETWVKHIQWAEWADLMLIAPCTANTLAKIVHGFSDNMLTAAVLAARCPVYICPTMDGEMYHAPSTKRNLQLAEDMNFRIIPPESGYLASGLNDTGRLPDADTIFSHLFPNQSSLPLANKKVLITTGPTREFIDPVRFISNPSSGKMGIAMAKAAKALGADVILLHGPITEKIPHDVTALPFESADDLFALVQKHGPNCDVAIMAAAVADYKPQEKALSKIKKGDAEKTLFFTRTPDSLQWLGENKKAKQILIGFAMETDNLEEHAREKIGRKKLDWVVGNTLNAQDSGFQHDTNRVLLLSSKDEKFSFEGLKTEVAKKVLETIFQA